MPLAVTVNGHLRRLDVPVHRTLLELLRDDLGLTGTKECCAEGECGACTVLLSGAPVNVCLILAVEADGAEVTTIEGLGEQHNMSRVQEAFLEEGGVQCGFCIPGMVMSAHAFLTRRTTATAAEIREALSGNLCRCGGYNQICEAVAVAAGAVEARR
jgi:carbon-monoxide dehydrogenase small subunit